VRPYLKKYGDKRAGSMTQVVQQVQSPEFKPQYHKKKEKEKMWKKFIRSYMNFFKYIYATQHGSNSREP
jgi:hypothetical protein